MIENEYKFSKYDTNLEKFSFMGNGKVKHFVKIL